MNIPFDLKIDIHIYFSKAEKLMVKFCAGYTFIIRLLIEVVSLIFRSPDDNHVACGGHKILFLFFL
jgi:hypothetical protein